MLLLSHLYNWTKGHCDTWVNLIALFDHTSMVHHGHMAIVDHVL